jgi:hypothetical protein
MPACPMCANCPCVGTCVSTKTCQGDQDCGQAEVCAPDSNCQPHCTPGCHSDDQCRPDQTCNWLDGQSCWCQTAPCAGACEKRADLCSTSTECGTGNTCTYEDPFCGGVKKCLPGCLADSDCAQGDFCALADCGPCCPGVCVQGPKPCQSDYECPSGEVCESGAGCQGPKSCVPGCHDQHGCQANETCVQNACLTCPCPGQCEQTSACSGNEPTCSTTLDCEWTLSYCTTGCCLMCPIYDMQPCPANQCAFSNGVNQNGCPNSPICASCCACPNVVDPVCGLNYQTYGNSCEAQCAGTTVLHVGECLPFEGLDCGFWGPDPYPCGTGEYCRDACPMCDMIWMRCTKLGSCVFDWDCPLAAGDPPTCSNATWTCQSDHTCSYTCN